MSIGVWELKQNLATHLRRVARGETLQITDCGVAVAVLSPVSAPDPFARGIEESWIRPPMVDGPIGHHPLETSTRRALDVLASDRDECPVTGSASPIACLEIIRIMPCAR
jgi:antitoxin (DNA-binding transcriptional repressor) of toxin-antitoxin stability system